MASSIPLVSCIKIPLPTTFLLVVFYMSCELAGVYYAKQNDLKDWGIEDNTDKRLK